MKKIILMIALLLTSAISQAQIKIVEQTKFEKIGKAGTPMSVEVTKSGETYYFTYKDFKFQRLNEWKSFEIKDVDNAFENLYGIIIQGLEDLPKEPIMIELEKGYLWLKFEKTLGIRVFSFSHSLDKNGDIIGFSNNFNKKQVAKLFGKN